jgi:hypothetical protein
MELLEELAFFLQKNKSKSLETYIPQGSKLRALYELAASKQRISDKQAAAKIYQSKPTDKKFLMLKRNLSRKLTDLILLCEDVDGEDNHYISAKLAAEKQLNIAEKLLQRNVYHNAEKIIQKVLREAEKQELKALQLQALLILRKTNALKGNHQEVLASHKKINQLQQWVQFEQQAQGMLEIIESQLKFSTACEKNVALQAKKFMDQIKDWLTEFPSPYLQFFYLQLAYHFHQQQNQSTKALIVIERTEQLLVEFSWLQGENQQLILLYRKALNLFLLREFSDAKKLIKQCIRISSYQAFNRYEVQALHFRMLLFNKEFENAGALLKEVLESEQYVMLEKIDQAAWLIREGFLFLNLKKHAPHLIPSLTPAFLQMPNLQDFMQQTQPLHRDKKGYFMQVWILKTFICFDYQQADLLFDETNKLKVYFQRYLKEIPETRTQAFIRSVYKAGKHFENKEKLESIKEKLYEQLTSDSLQLDYNEWIDFEEFWELIGIGKSEELLV